MTDALSPAAAAPSTAPRRPALPSRPDGRQALLEAIERRDPRRSRRLAERWVHRHGLVSLEAFQRGSLQTLLGPEACVWLRELLEQHPVSVADVPAAAGSVASQLGPEIRLHDLIPGDPGRPSPWLAAAEPLPSVEEAFAALAAEFASSAAASVNAEPVAAPTQAELEPIAAAAAEPAASQPPPPPAEVQAESDLEPGQLGDLGPGQLGDLEPGQVGEPALGVPPPDSPRISWHGRTLGRVSRVGSLLRACVEEAISGFHPGAPGVSEPDSAAAGPHPADDLPAPGPQEPLAPLPAFHPTESILAALPEAPAPAPGPQRWFPRLGLGGPARRPAPAPADLADLRAWLPDAADDLPRAC